LQLSLWDKLAAQVPSGGRAGRFLQLAGITTNPNEAWMKQIARNLADRVDGFLLGKRYLIMDRDSKFSSAFRGLIESEERKVKRIPARSPNCNAHIERFMRSIKDDCLNRLILFGEASLERAISSYLLYYHRERNHQGLGS
jgi:transposase InsO family protein